MTRINLSILATLGLFFAGNSLAVVSPELAQLEAEVAKTYADIALASYQDSLEGAQALQKDIAQFVQAAAGKQAGSLVAAKFEQAKKTWLIPARFPYGQTEIFRFANGPIDFEASDDGVTDYLESIDFESKEGLMNAWPLDENYIDYVVQDKNAGLVNNRAYPLTRELLVSMNEQGGEKNISTGYHAIEFLLWGQDRDLSAPGQRPYTDYTTLKNADRRREYLTLLADLLVDHLQEVVNQWETGKTNYRQELLAKDASEVVAAIFGSFNKMAGDELKSERIENALLLADQEDEHSCFSDNTINDIYTNASGIVNLYYGEYKSTNSLTHVKGTGVQALVKLVDPALDQAIVASINEVMGNISAFYQVNELNQISVGAIALPFDRALTEHPEMLQAIIDSLDTLDKLLVKANSLLTAE